MDRSSFFPQIHNYAGRKQIVPVVVDSQTLGHQKLWLFCLVLLLLLFTCCLAIAKLNNKGKVHCITNVDIGWQRPDDWAVALLNCIPVLACAPAKLNESALTKP